MFTEVRVKTSMEQEFAQTMSSLVRKLIGKKEIIGTETLRKQTYDLMKQLAKKFLYQQTKHSINSETKTEMTHKTEFSMHESVYTLIRKKPKKKKKECINSEILKHNTRSLHYSNICEMIKNNTTKLIRNKLTLHEKSKKIIKKRTYNREKSLTGKIESMEKLLSSWKKDFKKKAVVEDLKWSIKSTHKSFVMENEIVEQHIKPVPIVPPLSLPMWAKAMDEPPQTVILRRTPSLNSFFDPRTMRTKVIMRRRARNGSRKPRACMISTESLARALANPKWNKGPRQVPVSTFQATRIHYRFLLAKYGKARLMGRQRVYPNSVKSNVHSNFSVINLLHEVEEAISQNKYSKETDKMVKNFKDELNKDLLYNEPINRKYHKCQIGNANNPSTKRKGRLAKQYSGLSLSELVQRLGGNDSDDSYNEIDSDREFKSETCIETGQSQYLDTNNPLMNSLMCSDSNELISSFNNELQNTNASNKLKINVEDSEITKGFQNKKFVLKEKRTIKKKKVLMKDTKSENISEEERLSAILQELQKQVKTSEQPTPLFLTKNDSLTELNFEKEPCTYLSMQESSITIDSDSQSSHVETTIQKECNPPELPQQESKHSLLTPSEPTPPIKKNKPPKSQHSSTKLYTFRVDYECIKNKPMNICNIITALDRVNKLLQNIPIQYDDNTGQPYIVYDPKTIVKVIKEVNIKHEYKMVVKKYNKKSKIDLETDKTLCETKICRTETMVKQEKGLEEVGNQLLKCILNSMKPPDTNDCVRCIKDKDEFNKSSQTFEIENFNNEQSLVVTNSNAMTDSIAIKQLTSSTESFKLADDNIETNTCKKAYFQQVIKTTIPYHTAHIYHQVIIYLERQEYFSIVQTSCHKAQNTIHEIDQKKREQNATKLSSTSYAELKEKYTEEFKERKNTPNELRKKYGRHLTNENTNQTQTNISQKHYHQYSKTRKLLLSKYEFKRSLKKEPIEKVVTKPSIRTDLHENLNNNENNVKPNSFNKHSLPNIINESGSANQIVHIPTKMNIEKPRFSEDKRYKTNADIFQHLKGKDVKNKYDFIIGQNRAMFNPFITLDSYEQVINNNNSSNNTRNISEGSGGFPINRTIMNNMLRSVSINTIPNTFPIRKDITKQVFFFQTTHPLIEDLSDIYKQRPSHKFFKNSQNDIFSKFIYFKEDSKIQTYKNDINQQVMDYVNSVKEELNKNNDNICRIVNIDKCLLIKFLKICLKQNELDFKENKKSQMLEKEIEELKALMKEHLGKKNKSLKLIQRKRKGPSMIKFEIISKINQLILKNESKVNKISKNKFLNSNLMYTKTTYPIIKDLNYISTKPSQESFKSLQHKIFNKFINYKENRKYQKYKQDINQVMDSVNTIINDLNKNINNICQIVNIENKLLVKFLKICLKQNYLDYEKYEKSLMLEKEMEELKALMEEHLGEKTNPLRFIDRKSEGTGIKSHHKKVVFKNNFKINQSTLKNESNVEEINTNQILFNNRLYSEILTLMNFLMLIFSFISFFS